MVLVSFDIDVTMTLGDPPGTVTTDMVRKAKQLGCIIGSASDRPISNQQLLWDTHEVEVDFITLKHNLTDIRERMPDAERYLHIGDTDVDHHFAKLAGFDFCFGHEVVEQEPWLMV